HDTASRATDVKRPHGQLRARLANRLSGNNSNRHAFFDEVAGCQVHAVAQPAYSQGGLTSHRAADQDLIHAELFDFAGAFPRDHLILADDHVAGDSGDIVSTDPAANTFAQGTFNFLALVDDALGDAKRGAAVVHGDDDVLSDVGQLASEVAGVRGL